MIRTIRHMVTRTVSASKRVKSARRRPSRETARAVLAVVERDMQSAGGRCLGYACAYALESLWTI